MTKLAPSILSADFSMLGQQVSLIEKGGAQIIHVDVMDGHFVPNISFGSTVMKSLLGKTLLPFDVHLMIEHPEKYIEDFVTTQTEYITVHYETCKNLEEVIMQIKALGIKAGVSINPDTEVAKIDNLLDQVDLVLVMSVYPGFGGQKLITQTLEKVTKLDTIRKEKKLKYEIEIDGGITKDNIMEPVKRGADIIVAGSAVFNTEDVTKTTMEFCQKIV